MDVAAEMEQVGVAVDVDVFEAAFEEGAGAVFLWVDGLDVGVEENADEVGDGGFAILS